MTSPADAPGSEAIPARDRVASVLRVAQALSQAAGIDEALADVLEALARALEADHAGFVVYRGAEIWLSCAAGPHGPQKANPTPPWDGQPDALADARRSSRPFVGRSPRGAWYLVTAAPPHENLVWAVWVEGKPGQVWQQEEHNAFRLAALALSDAVAHGEYGRRWADWLANAQRVERLEDAAVIVNRLAHDFNNLLAGIVGFSQLGIGLAPRGSELCQFLAEILQAAESGAALVQQVARFGRRSNVPPVSTSVTDVIAEGRLRLDQQAAQGPRYELHTPDDLDGVALEPDAVRHILGELVANAAEASGPDGTVTVSARPVELSADDCRTLLGAPAAGPHVELTVTDTGPGFSAEARQRVLVQPFFSTKPKRRGLGLAGVYGFLAARRGGLCFDHAAGRGATVRVYLPVAPPYPQAGRGWTGRHPNKEPVLANNAVPDWKE